MTSRSSTAAPILAVLAIVQVMLGAYVGGYFWLGKYENDPFGDGGMRFFPHWSYATMFRTKAKITSPGDHSSPYQGAV